MKIVRLTAYAAAILIIAATPPAFARSGLCQPVWCVGGAVAKVQACRAEAETKVPAAKAACDENYPLHIGPDYNTCMWAAARLPVTLCAPMCTSVNPSCHGGSIEP